MNFFSFVAESHLSPSQQISWLILHSLWQGLVVALFVFTINTLMWRASAKFRYWIAVVGLLAMIVGVFSTWWMMQPATWVVDATPATWAVASDEIVMPQLTMSDSMDPTVFETVRPSALEKWAPFVALVYLIGVGMMWLRLTLSVIGVNRLRRGSISVEKQLADRVYSLANQIGVRARPALKTCERTVIPFAAGVFRPVILLPTFAISGMTQSELDAIFLHELAHIGRGDLIVNVVQRFAESFFFFNPATWYISRVITTERENCCDDIVLGQCDQSTYASALIRLAESLTGKPEDVAPVVALAATGAKPSQLKRRVQRILGVPTAPRNPSVGVVLSCVLVMAIAAVQLHAQSDDGESSKAGVFLEATDENRDLEIRTPLIVSFDKKGVVSSFTAFSLDSSMSDSAQRDRFNSILKNIQTDKRVVIDTTRVRRKRDGTLAMTVSGENLKTDAIQAAIRQADAPTVKDAPLKSYSDATTEVEKEKAFSREDTADEQSILETLHQLKLAESKLELRYGPDHPNRRTLRRQIQLTRELIDEQKKGDREVKILALVERERPNLDGPVRIEFVDDSDVFVVRGKKEDVDHIMKVIGEFDRRSNEATEKKPDVKKEEPKNPEDSLSSKIGSDREGSYYVYDLKNVVAVEAQKVLLSLLRRHEKDITVDRRRNSIVVSDRISPENLASIRKTLERMDRVAEGSTTTMSYHSQWEPILKAILKDVDRVRIATDARTKYVIVDAPMATHQKIKVALKAIRDPVEFSTNFPGLKTQLLKGKMLYKQHCTHCHGKNGQGDGPTAKSLDPKPRRFASDEFLEVRMGTDKARHDLEAVLLFGMDGTAMPSFNTLTRTERSSLAAYVEYIALRGRLEKNRAEERIRLRADQKRPNANAVEGALRFPIDVERAMMGNRVVPEIRREGDWKEFDPNPSLFLVPEAIERGMQIDAVEGDVKY